MKIVALSFLSVMLLAAAGPAKPPAPLKEIPARAVALGDGSYRYTDAQGRKWILRKTPFGISRVADTPAATKPAPAVALDNARAFEDGDFIRFERPGPFGTYKWQRRKTELDSAEKAVWERQQKALTAKQD